MVMVMHAAKVASLRVSPTKIERARRILGTKTRQETVDRALDVVLGEERLLRVHRRIKGVGGFVDALAGS